MTTEQRAKGITWMNGRLQEHAFFDKKPWCDLDKSRLGTQNLVLALSSQLSKMILER
jgi:hypothetical protein